MPKVDQCWEDIWKSSLCFSLSCQEWSAELFIQVSLLVFLTAELYTCYEHQLHTGSLALSHLRHTCMLSCCALVFPGLSSISSALTVAEVTWSILMGQVVLEGTQRSCCGYCLFLCRKLIRWNAWSIEVLLQVLWIVSSRHLVSLSRLPCIFMQFLVD